MNWQADIDNNAVYIDELENKLIQDNEWDM